MTGERLWSFETQAGVLAAPISYQVDGEQYVAIEVGYGGAFGLAAGELSRDTHIASNVPRVLVFKLGAQGALPPLSKSAMRRLHPPADTASAADLVKGKMAYHTYCGTCHGDSATGNGVLPDLRYTALLNDRAAWDSIVLQGADTARGMVSFKAELDQAASERIRAYIIHRATEDQTLEATSHE
jgi:alcohol dehydrogenase (cytochrome c)/quinohemoprotein ethanol dehydrogenase